MKTPLALLVGIILCSFTTQAKYLKDTVSYYEMVYPMDLDQYPMLFVTYDLSPDDPSLKHKIPEKKDDELDEVKKFEKKLSRLAKKYEGHYTSNLSDFSTEEYPYMFTFYIDMYITTGMSGLSGGGAHGMEVWEAFFRIYDRRNQKYYRTVGLPHRCTCDSRITNYPPEIVNEYIFSQFKTQLKWVLDVLKENDDEAAKKLFWEKQNKYT